jgi:hypothetical protein
MSLIVLSVMQFWKQPISTLEDYFWDAIGNRVSAQCDGIMNCQFAHFFRLLILVLTRWDLTGFP